MTAAERYAARQRRKADREREAAELAAARADRMAAAQAHHSDLRLKILRRDDCLSTDLVDRHFPVLHWREAWLECGGCPYRDRSCDTWPCVVVKALERHADCRGDLCVHSE
jgi:hypothetical protein